VNSSRLLVTDADNTLWETDAVYAAAQLNLLHRVEAAYQFDFDSRDRLGFVRGFDQAIARRHQKGLRYPVGLLVRAIASFGAQQNLPRAVAEALATEHLNSTDEGIADSFVSFVANEVPELRSGVVEAVPTVARNDVKIVVFTEADSSRCKRLLTIHGLIKYVYAIVSERKSVEAYRELSRRFEYGQIPVMVGDQLDRDIELSQLAGYRTVHFPGSFNPEWVQSLEVSPDFVIASFNDVLGILDIATHRSP